MIKNRLAKWVFGSAFLTSMIVPMIAFAQESGGAVTQEPWQATVGKAASAGFAMGVSAFAGGYAQAKIGSAGAGTLAERPEVSIWIITLQALPEVIVLLGFVSAIMITGA